MKFIEAKLPVNFYKEGKKFIAYCPALDISTCGDTFEATKKNFEELVDIFIKETTKMGTLEEVLLECGWKKGRCPTAEWKPPIREFIAQIEEKVKIPCPT